MVHVAIFVCSHTFDDSIPHSDGIFLLCLANRAHVPRLRCRCKGVRRSEGSDSDFERYGFRPVYGGDRRILRAICSRYSANWRYSRASKLPGLNLSLCGLSMLCVATCGRARMAPDHWSSFRFNYHCVDCLPRGTGGLAAIGYFLVFAISSLRQWTARKAVLLGLGIAVVCLLVPVILASFATRFNAQQDSNYDERAAFESAATMMISDHPMGVGANYYVVEANVSGYNDRAHVAYVIGSDSANVHNIYYLITAETGYLGLLTFVFVLLRPLVVAFRCGWRNKRDRRGDLLLGLGTALLIVYVHSFFEWIFISFAAQYMFALDAGMVAGIATQLGYWRPSETASRVTHSSAKLPKGLVVD